MAGDEPRHVPLVVLGGGPGGYPAAFAAADAGHDVVVVDDGPLAGGTCLRSGCIPSKALLHVAKVIAEASELSGAGVMYGAPDIDLERLRAWKDEIVVGLGGGVGQLAAGRSVEWITARGVLRDAHMLELEPTNGEGSSLLGFDQLVLATGSRPIRPSSLSCESPRVMDSAAALGLPDVPKRLLVVGGGYIGLELGTVYRALGCRVTVVEMAGGLLPGADRDLVRPLARRLDSQFEAILLNTLVESLTVEGDEVSAVLVSADGERDVKTFDRVLVAVGRRPNSDGLGLAAAGIEMSEAGEVVVDAAGRTTCDHIFAVGDLCGGAMLAHKATSDARRVVAALDGQPAADVAGGPQVVPAVVFTDPEIAWCGLTESEARDTGRAVKVSRVPWAASGRAHSTARTDGMTKLLCEPDGGQLLGAGIVGAGAGELIAEASVAIRAGLTASEIASAIHPHPTLSETLAEAAEHSVGQAIHLLPRRRK